MGFTYRDAGVDVDGGNRFVSRIAPLVKATFSDRVITDIGGFGALYSGSFPGMSEPVLVSGTDGVGTKLKLAQWMNKHDTIGIDAVAMCVNDLLVSGAAPLFFLDYIACGRLNEDIMVQVVGGIAEGCRIAGCSLIGGETAEHPGVMQPDDYDIAGFAVGVVDRPKIIDGKKIRPGDVIIGLPSSGVHSNGFSMVRKLLFEVKKYTPDSRLADLDAPLGEALLEPTRIYCRPILDCLERGAKIVGMVHITGGGFYENIPRILPDGFAAIINRSSFTPPPVFELIRREGQVEEREMFTTFNMGIGLMMMAGKTDADGLIRMLRDVGEKPVIIGTIEKRTGGAVVLV
ncbi:MAG TPA: phosphoribosylformylglycinamidine cyclo-ligase [Spirochaetota bacterium]|nr:phosphoribosylformylglycinamidine cyclo-ligase [Spirochaetota bacterium]